MVGHVGGAPVVEHLLDLPERFWTNISIDGDPKTACWEWVGRRWPTGYGRWNQHNWGYQAHRVVWSYYHGEIPEGLQLDHVCAQDSTVGKACVNPLHLEPVTQAENLRRWTEQNIQACPKGHPYTYQNTASGRYRRCLRCAAERRWAKAIAKSGGRPDNQRMRPDSPQRRPGRRTPSFSRLGVLIDQSGLLMHEVATLVGVTSRTMSDWANLRAEIPVKKLNALAQLFDLPKEEIVGRTPAPRAG